jgi:hypothetical protein
MFRQIAFTLALVAGCSTDLDSDDPIDGTFSTDGKADGDGVSSDDACSILKLSNLASEDELRGDAHLSKAAADAIAAYRAGDDGELGTLDDNYFATLEDLDAVPYVGEKTFFKLWVHAQSHAEYHCVTQPVQILAFNDFHGNLKPPAGTTGRIVTGPNPTDYVDAGGVEYLATHIRQLRTGHANTVTVAAGDVIGGSPLMSAVFKNEPSIEAMNALGLDFAAVGNHEFDKGPGELRRCRRVAASRAAASSTPSRARSSSTSPRT